MGWPSGEGGCRKSYPWWMIRHQGGWCHVTVGWPFMISGKVLGIERGQTSPYSGHTQLCTYMYETKGAERAGFSIQVL